MSKANYFLALAAISLTLFAAAVVQADVVFSTWEDNKTVLLLFGKDKGQVAEDTVMPLQTKLYDVMLFSEKTGNKFPYRYTANTTGDNWHNARQSDKAASHSTVTWERETGSNIPKIAGGTASVQISIPLTKIEGSINVIQFLEGNADFTNLNITTYDSSGNNIDTWGLDNFVRHAYLYNTDENGEITGLFEDAASITISLTIIQYGGVNAGGGDGNLWAGNIYILGTGKAYPFPDPLSGTLEVATPEPATLTVLGFGLVGLAALRRRKR